jgi:hypothetical protein
MGLIRGGVKSKRLSCATIVFSGVTIAMGFSFVIGNVPVSDELGVAEGLSCPAAVELNNKAIEATEHNARRI